MKISLTSIILITILIISSLQFTISDTSLSSSSSSPSPPQSLSSVVTISMVSKIQSYTYCNFSPTLLSNYSAILNIPYPQYIGYSGQSNASNILTLMFRNLTNQLQAEGTNAKFTMNITKNFTSQCEITLADVDYFGGVPKWPYYRLIILCSNSTHELANTLQVFSGGYQTRFIYGTIVKKVEQDQMASLYQQKQLKVVNVYNGTNNIQSTKIIKFYNRINPETKPQFGAFYKSYTASKSTPQVINIENLLQKSTGLKNLYINDAIFGINKGDGVSFNAYISQNYGILISNNLNEHKLTWKPQNQQKSIKIAKICWSNTIVILTEGQANFLYFLKLNLNPNNSSVSVNSYLKSVSIQLQPGRTLSQCELLTIGKYAICQQVSKVTNNTIWYILWVQGNNVNLKIERFSRILNKIWVSQDLCGSAAFYEGNAKYIISPQFSGERIDQQASYTIIQRYLRVDQEQAFAQLQTEDSEPGQNLFIISTKYPQNISYYYCNDQQCKVINSHQGYILTPPQITIVPAQPNNLSISFQIHSFTPAVNQSTPNTPLSFYTVFLQNNSETFAPYLNFGASLALNVSDYGFLNSQPNYANKSYTTSYIGKTSIQKNVFGQILPLSNNQNENRVVYGYEVQAEGYKKCVYRTTGAWGQQNIKILLLRVDEQSADNNPLNKGLIIKAITLRHNKTYTLQHTRSYPQFGNSSYQPYCTHDTITLYSPVTKKFVFFSQNLTVVGIQNSYQLVTQIKTTSKYLLYQMGFGAYVNIMPQNEGQRTKQVYIFGGYNVSQWVTGSGSSGFINRGKHIYVNFKKRS